MIFDDDDYNDDCDDEDVGDDDNMMTCSVMMIMMILVCPTSSLAVAVSGPAIPNHISATAGFKASNHHSPISTP